MSSKVHNTTIEFKPIIMPALTFYYTPQLYKSFELQLGLGAEARGGKTTRPSAKYRSYDASGILGMRVKLKDFKIGGGLNPVYFLDTRKTVLEGSLSSGVVHITTKHFVQTDLPIYASAELKLNELFSVEIRYSRSLSEFTSKTVPTFRTFSITANYLIASRYKRVKIPATN